jgi:predicted permease
VDVNALRSTVAADAAAQRGWFRNSLVFGQVAIASAILVLSGWCLQELRAERRIDPGFRIDNVVALMFNTGNFNYDEQQTRKFYSELLTHVRNIPGVRSAALSSYVPLFGGTDSGAAITLDPELMPSGRLTIDISRSVVGEGYFETLGIPILRGRAFDRTDTASSPRVIIINQAMADKFWPHRDPLGDQIRIKGTDGSAQIVGIARTAKYHDIDEWPAPFFYQPLAQSPAKGLSLFVEASSAKQMIPALRAEALRIDANQPPYEVFFLQDLARHQALWALLLITQVVSVVACVGLILAVLGLYGVLAYAVSRRTHEIGIRMAVGATRLRVLGMILYQGLRLSVAGIVCGVGFMFALSPAIDSWLSSGVSESYASAREPITFIVTSVVLLATAFLACYIPARRAASVDPVIALRAE